MLRLSVLDQSVAVAGRPQDEAIRNTIALARHCEALGYERFWVSEHHNSPTIMGTAPEILIAAIAATTSRIRVGSAGVMLPHYSAFKVAEQFRVLDAIAPGRIDLGLGRAPGSDGRTAYALNPLADQRPAHFPADVRDILAWLAGKPLMEGHPFASIHAYPQSETVPETWILGSSNYGAEVGAYFGLPYCYAYFFAEGSGYQEALAIYRETYRPSERHPNPQPGLGVWALAADTTEEAEFQFLSRAKHRLLRDRGVFSPLEAPDVAAATPFTPDDKARIERMKQRSFVGTADDVASRLADFAKASGVEDLVIVTWSYEETVRQKSYALLAEVFGLGAAASAPKKRAGGSS